MIADSRRRRQALRPVGKRMEALRALRRRKSHAIVYNESRHTNAPEAKMSERLSEAEFQKKAEEAIKELERAFGDLAESKDIDVEVEGGVLSVTFEEGEPGKYIVSPNSSVRQVWVS